MREAVIVDAVRTPLGRGKENGALHGWHPGRSRRRDAARRWSSAPASIPAEVEDVIMGCVGQVGEQGVNVGRNAALAAGFPESVRRHHRRPPVRLEPAGAALRRPGRDGRRLRRRHRRRRRVDEPRADGHQRRRRRRAVRPAHDRSATPKENLYGAGGLVHAGHLGRDHRRASWKLSRRELDTLLARLAPEGGRGHAQRLVRQRDRADRDHATPTAAREHGRHRRGHPPRHHDREARLAQAGVPRRTA